MIISNKAEPDNIIVFRLITVLILVALAIVFMRIIFSENEALSRGDSAWTVSYSVSINVIEKGEEFRVSAIQNSRYLKVYGQSLYHPGMQQKKIKKSSDAAEIVFVANAKGDLPLRVSFDIFLSPISLVPKIKTLKENDLSKWLLASTGVHILPDLLTELINKRDISELTVEDKVEYLFNTLSERIRIIESSGDDGRSALKLKYGSELGVTNGLLSILRTAHIPSRLVTGINLVNSSFRPAYWVETYYQGQWHSMDIINGYFGLLPMEMIPLRRDSSSIVKSNQRDSIPVIISVLRQEHIESQYLEKSKNFTQIFNFARIPPEGRAVLALIILLPIGILVTEMLRQFIAIRTFGTFTPTLLAMTAVYTELQTMFIVISLVLILGVSGLALLPKVNFTRVARLSIVFTIVSIIMVFAVSTLLFFNPVLDTSIVLLPIVILTTLVDRFYTVKDDFGINRAIKRLLWTLVAALISLVIHLINYIT